MLLRYFYFATPQFVYYIIPMAVLVATLVTIGLLTKNSELIVMRACGISLYRSALPLLLFALLLSGVLFELQEQVLADSNREAARSERDHPRLPDAELRRARTGSGSSARAATSITTSSSTRARTSSASCRSIASNEQQLEAGRR